MCEGFNEARQIDEPNNLFPVFRKIPAVLDESTREGWLAKWMAPPLVT